MTVHLLKVAVGEESIDDLRRWHATRLRKHGRLWHATRMVPRRASEVIDGGSIYWIIKGAIRVRQRILDIEDVVGPDGRKCVLLLDPDLVPTEPVPRRPHQGWRYLEVGDAPADLGDVAPGVQEMPAEMVAELRELGLL
ncbi:MAG: DUF1489 domain-containing protein [Minwuiales bacterium]|nr:DUF1489 domain-containing protein [Minwuiales bacterium]